MHLITFHHQICVFQMQFECALIYRFYCATTDVTFSFFLDSEMETQLNDTAAQLEANIMAAQGENRLLSRDLCLFYEQVCS